MWASLLRFLCTYYYYITTLPEYLYVVPQFVFARAEQGQSLGMAFMRLKSKVPYAQPSISHVIAT